MKRSITRWTMAAATAGLLSLPVSSFARTTQDPQPQPQQQQPPAQPQPQQPTPTPEQPAPTPQQPAPTPQQPTPTPQDPTPTQQPSATAAQPQADKELTPQDHLKKAQEAANQISTMSVPAKNRSDVEQLKKHLSNLEKASSSTATPTESAKKDEAKGSANWGTEVAAIDKIITEMVGSESATPAAPKPTGTSGREPAALDDATRGKLMEVRTHITAFAAGMAGTSTPKTEAAASPETPAARPEPSMTQPATQSPTPAAPPAQNPPATPNPSPQQQQPDPNAAQPPATQPSPTNQPPAAQGQTQQVDTEAAHRHLLAARETLAQLTQLPAATQLSGEPRNQVSQLITNFNELITTQSNWKASYDKVAANLSTLIGPDNSDNEATGGAPTPNAGATPTPNQGATPTTPNAGAAPPSAVGTAGTASAELDPAIRAKLVELRKNLNDFKKAAGAGQ